MDTSRILKFRAWNKQLEKMHSAEEMGEDQLTLSVDGRGLVNINSQAKNLSLFYDHIIPLQFTGINDIEGQEIYEGDIVHQLGGINWEVRWIKAAATFAVVNEIEGQLMFFNQFTPSRSLTVVGNIYENPELLKKIHPVHDNDSTQLHTDLFTGYGNLSCITVYGSPDDLRDKNLDEPDILYFTPDPE